MAKYDVHDCFYERNLNKLLSEGGGYLAAEMQYASLFLV